MHYTSGTTGKPKGVKRALNGLDPDDCGRADDVPAGPVRHHAGAGPNAHLVTSPNYHTAVTQFGGTALHMGHTLVYMDKWDAEEMLRLMRAAPGHQLAHGARPTSSACSRCRRRPATSYDLSSLRWMIHAAAPCPVPVKWAMLDWWGDCI